MIRFADRDEKHLYIYGDASEVMEMINKVSVVRTTTYQNGPALIVKKEALEKEEM